MGYEAARVLEGTHPHDNDTRASAVASDRRGQVGARERSLPLRLCRHDGRAEEDDPCSVSINSYAVPLLVSETLQAQSANINLVSGATDTSDAYVQSLQSAIKKATSATAL